MLGVKRVIIALVLALCITATAQSEKTQRFRWDWRNAQELDLKHTIGKSHELSHEDKRELLRAIAQQMKTVMDADAGAHLAALATKTRVKAVDLNGDGAPEVIAQPVGLEAGCGATGNCPFWVFEKTRTGYKLILGTKGFQVFTIESRATEGFRDIVLGSHDSASERTLYVFRYSGGRYHEGECHNVSWWTYEGGFHKLREPNVTPCAR